MPPTSQPTESSTVEPSPGEICSSLHLNQSSRSKLLIDVLNSLIPSVRPSESREHIATLQHALTVASLVCEETDGGIDDRLMDNGGLMQMDLRRFASPSTSTLDIQAQNLISEEIDSILQSISTYWNSSISGSDGMQGSSARDLYRDIQTRLGKIEVSEKEADDAYDRIQLLLQEIQQIHPRLQQRLAYALEKFPRDVEGRSSSNNDLLAMTIEASLVKVSLIRAQVLESVYNYSSPKNPELQMRGALSAAYAKLKEDERELDEEERKLDHELAQYQLLDMVDGGGSGGFRQLVADTARVEKETEECRKDLRRLGWTGER